MMTDMLFKVVENVWHYTEEASPWLLFGFLFAGILKAFIPSEILLKYLGGSKLRSVLTATLVGIPLPLCSCGVIPTGLSLYEQGASKPSTLAFLIATPATSITSIFLVFGMLGWRFTVAGIATSFCVAVITGLLAGVILKVRTPPTPACSPTDQNLRSPPLRDKMKTVFRYGFIDMIDDIGLYILVGLIGAGIIAAMIPPEIVGAYLGGSASLIIMVLLATPMYICSTGSVPFVASLIAKGMNPAAGLVVLIVGPATNLSTMLVIGKTMGKKTAILYTTSIIVLSVLIAYSFHLVGWL